MPGGNNTSTRPVSKPGQPNPVKTVQTLLARFFIPLCITLSQKYINPHQINNEFCKKCRS
jgi:hypothetical protein